MEHNHFIIKLLTFLCVAVVASQAALSSSRAQSYWNSELPNTPIPQAIKDSLPQTSGKSGTNVGVGKGGVSVHAPGGANVGVGKGGVSVGNVGKHEKSVRVHSDGQRNYLSAATEDQLQGKRVKVHLDGQRNYLSAATENQLHGKRVKVHLDGQRNYLSAATEDQLHGKRVGVHPDGQRNYLSAATEDQLHGKRVGVHPDGQRNYRSAATEDQLHGKRVGVHSDGQRNYLSAATEDQLHGKRVGVHSDGQRNYLSAATKDQLHDDPSVALYFRPAALHRGNTDMTLDFTKTENDAVFLPQTESEKIPFSSQNIPEILNRFSVNPDSDEAQAMKQTIKECEDPAIMGEEKQCATSLESMIEFSKSKLGSDKKIQAVSTETLAGDTSSIQKYTISGVEKLNKNEGVVVCHKQSFPYAVFYCHKSKRTDAFKVSLVGGNGGQVKAAAVCHKDTTVWNPKHLAFQVLKVKPGVPVCHFLSEDTIVWVAQN